MDIATVISADGTPIQVFSSGAGPPMVMVHGGLLDRRALAQVVLHLAPSRTVHTFDRRGRGTGLPAEQGSAEREVDDIAAVIEHAGPPVDLYGHSAGAMLALRAALRGLPVRGLLLYEPPFIVDGGRPRPPSDLADRLEAMLAAGELEAALVAMATEGMAIGPDQVAQLRTTPVWSAWMGQVRTAPMDVRIAGDGLLPLELLRSLPTPALVLQGGASPAWMRAGTAALAEALPLGRLAVLEGQGHAAAQTAPQLLAGEMLQFLEAGA